MNTFVHMDGLSLIEKDGKRLEAFLKPEFTFEYDTIQFHEQSRGYVLNGNWLEFTPEQSTEVAAYITSQEEDSGSKDLMEAYMYLQETDWIVSKLAEKQLLGEAINELMLQYSAELQKREEARQTINGV